MNIITGTIDYQKVTEQLDSYFPDTLLVKDSLDFKTEDGTEILVGPDKILPYLQTILFEEHLIEIQLDFTTRLFYAHLLDDLPDLLESELEGELVLEEPDYENGSYLKSCANIAITALTPGMGNVKIQTSNQVTVRFFSGTSAIEMGSSFVKRDTIRGVPVLRLSYPHIGRVNRSYRPFRVKSISTIDAVVDINTESSSKSKGNLYQVVDISAMGIAFTILNDASSFVVGEEISMEVKVPGVNDLALSGTIRHISRTRSLKGYQNICGVQFDLKTRSIAADIERLVAAIQRLQLREISNRTASLSGVRLIK